MRSENVDSDEDQDRESVRSVQDDGDTDVSDRLSSVSDGGDQEVCDSDQEVRDSDEQDSDSFGAEEQLALVASRLQQLLKSLPPSKLSLPASHACQAPSFVTTI